MAGQHAVIAGASAAGLAAADGLREGGWTGSITVLGEERHQPYDRPMLSKGLLASHLGQPVALRSSDQLTEQGIDLLTGQAARGLDIDRRYVITSDGAVLPWDTLVLATGSRPRTLKTTGGAALPVLRTVDDLEMLRQCAASGRSVTVVGAGLIGLEVASALRCQGLAVTVVAAEPLPLEQILGTEIATWLWDQHLARGVVGRLGRSVTSVEGQPDEYRVYLDDGTSQDSQLVLAGIGVVPSAEWLVGSGIRLRGGVLCDRAGRTNVPDVWAAGDVARIEAHGGREVGFGHWANAIEQGRQVGLNIARGEDMPYHGLRSFWTVQYGNTIRSMGTREVGDLDDVVEGDVASGEFVVLHRDRDGAWHGITACRRDRSMRGYRKLLLGEADLTEAYELARRQNV